MGDVFQIALPNSAFAYGRIYKDARVSIYANISKSSNSPPTGSREFLFQVGIYRKVLTSGEFPIVGHDEFETEEEAWGQPMFIQDPINKLYSIYHKGIITKSNEEECRGLEQAAVWDSHHIIERIMSGLDNR